jgi:hypothetical protein
MFPLQGISRPTMPLHIVLCHDGVSAHQTHMPLKLTPEIIAAAIDGFELQKKRLDDQIAELRQMFRPASATGSAAPPPTRRKRKMSAAGRKAIGDAARRRWAAVKAARAQAAAAPAKAGRKKVAKRARKSSTRRRGAAKAPATASAQNL